MRQAFFITGFNNWGKTIIIQDLFHSRRIIHRRTHRIIGVNFNTQFTVETRSNDDLVGQRWVNQIQRIINESSDRGENLFSALCPSLEPRNNFIELLTNTPFSDYDRLHIFLIEYKWEHHAKLIIDNILEVGQRVSNANFILINADKDLTIDADRYNAKLLQIRQELNTILGSP